MGRGKKIKKVQKVKRIAKDDPRKYVIAAAQSIASILDGIPSCTDPDHTYTHITLKHTH